MTRFLLRIISILALISLGCIAYGLLIEPRQLKVREFDFISETYTGPPLRIGLMTDIHIGGVHVPAERVAKIVSQMNALNPDLVLMPGDFIDGHDQKSNRSSEFVTAVETGLSHLSKLSAPSYATLGNHDAWYGAKDVATHLENGGVTVMNNAMLQLDQICLVGLADFDTGHPDRTVFESCETTSLAFTHSPQAWQSFRSDTILALAGHTHGWQVNLPLIGRRVNSTRLGPQHSYGFSKLGGVDVFVSAGIGTSILPVRFRSPPEIVVINLRPQD